MTRCRWFLPVACCLAPIVACSSDGATTPDDPGPTPLPTSAQSTIGTAGGSVAVEGMTFTVPSGAFASDADIQVSTLADDGPFGESAKSPLFRIDGLPDEFSAPLTIEIAHDGGLAEESFIAVGEDVLILEEPGGTTVAYSLLAASETGGVLTAQVPRPDGPAATASSRDGAGTSRRTAVRAGDNTIHTLIVDGVTIMQSSHFRLNLIGSATSETDADLFLAFLEDAYDAAQRLGLDFAQRADPIEVSMQPSTGRTGFVGSRWGDDYGTIQWEPGPPLPLPSDFSPPHPQDLEHFAADAVFALVLDLYDPRHRFEKVLGGVPEHAWLALAVRWWVFESSICGVNRDRGSESPHSTACLTSLERWPEAFDGFQDNQDPSTATLIDYLVSKYGQGLILRVFNKIKADEYAIEAIVNATESPVVWLAAYYRSLLTGDVYGGVRSHEFGELDTGPEVFSHDNFELEEGETGSTMFSYDFPDLSGRVYRINEVVVENAPTQEAVFTVTGGIHSEVTVFNPLGNGELTLVEYLADNVQTVTVPLPNHGDLTAVVSNSRAEAPYTDTTPIDLTVTVQEIPTYNTLNLRVTVLGTVNDFDNQPVQASITRQISNGGSKPDGSWTGNVFSVTWTDFRPPGGSEMFSGSLTAVLNDDRTRVLSIEGDETMVLSNGNGWTTTIVGHDIDFGGFPQHGGRRFSVSGAEACSKITTLTWVDLTGEPLL